MITLPVKGSPTGRDVPVRGLCRGPDGVDPPARAGGRQRDGARRALHVRPESRRRPGRPGELPHITHAPGLWSSLAWR